MPCTGYEVYEQGINSITWLNNSMRPTHLITLMSYNVSFGQNFNLLMTRLFNADTAPGMAGSSICETQRPPFFGKHAVQQGWEASSSREPAMSLL